VADVGNLDMALASVGRADDEEEDKKRQERTDKSMQWLGGAHEPKGLVLVSGGPIDHSTVKYDSPLTLKPIPRALSTCITDI
jgi:hypothetical protein